MNILIKVSIATKNALLNMFSHLNTYIDDGIINLVQYDKMWGIMRCIMLQYP